MFSPFAMSIAQCDRRHCGEIPLYWRRRGPLCSYRGLYGQPVGYSTYRGPSERVRRAVQECDQL